MALAETPNFSKNEGGSNTVSIEEFFKEVYNYAHSDAALKSKKDQWKRINRYTKHDHNGLTPQQVWQYIRENTKDDVDEGHRLAAEFLRGYVTFCRIDNPDIKLDLHFVKPANQRRRSQRIVCVIAF